MINILFLVFHSILFYRSWVDSDRSGWLWLMSYTVNVVAITVYTIIISGVLQ
jgi:uncharacterized membrane protein YhaH (DUF805 family)